jgi:Ran GTPase-activating protein (RanGAP) involved in mRNA processing and transport
VELVHANFDDHQAKYFAQAWMQMSSSSSSHVHTLIISFRNLVDDGAQALASAILQKSKQQQSSIRTLQLRDCRNHARELTIFLQQFVVVQPQPPPKTNPNHATLNITEFSLRHACAIDSNMARGLAQTLHTLRHSIQEFRLTDTPIVCHEAWTILAHGLGKIERVYLIHNEIRNVTPLAHVLEQSQTRIRQLHLCENELSDDQMTILTTAIVRNHGRRHHHHPKQPSPSLDLLDLRSNHFTAESALSIQGMLVGLAAAANGTTTSLKTLILSHNELGDLGTKAISRGLEQQIIFSRKQQNNSTSLSSKDHDHFTSVTKISTTTTTGVGGCLAHLDLSHNRIGTMGAMALADALRKNKNIISGCGHPHQHYGLHSLNLSFNHIGDEGVKALAKALASTTTHKTNRSSSSSSSTTSLQQQRQYQQQLRILHLRHNGITDAGAVQMAKYLPEFQSLKELVLSKNHIGEAGALALLRGLRSNVELEYLETTTTSANATTTTNTNLHHQAHHVNNIHVEMTRLLRLNKAGRRILRSQQEVPESTWAIIYERVRHDSDALFYFLTAQPPVVIDDPNKNATSATPPSPARKKTKL